MKLPRLAKTLALITAFLGIEQIPVDAEKQELNLTAEQEKKLKDHFGEDFHSNMKEVVNQEIKAVLNKDMAYKSAHDELMAILKEQNIEAENNNREDKDERSAEDEMATGVKALGDSLAKEKEAREKLEATVKQLMGEGLGDAPLAVIKNEGKMRKHSATHLFGSNNEWDKFENRPWNARLRDNGVKATDFSANSNIPLLEDDVEHFVRQNPTVLNSLFNDFAGLPPEWDHQSGIVDRVASGFIIPGEVVQGRSKGWKPKGKYKIAAEEGRVFAKKIDVTFTGYELQQMETTWIRNVVNLEGSHPWKMSFIGYVLSELVKRQKLDDRVAQINGIYAQTPDGDGNPGAAVNSQDGLRFLFWHHRDVTKKYRATDLGTPTADNILDYVRNLILSVPEIERAEQGLEFGLSQAWLDAYRVKAGLVYQMQRSSDQGKQGYDKDYPIDYPNIKFQPLRDMAKTDFMYITKSKNIQTLDYDTSEQGKFTVTHEKRDTNIFADYRLGIRLILVGTKLAEGDPAEFEKQAVWSNSVPVFDSKTSVPVFDDESGIINFHYANMKVDAGWKTNITNIENAPKGMIIRITGNTSLAAAKNVVDNANFDLAGNAAFDLSTGGTLTLKVQDNGTFKEIKRTTAPESAAMTDVNFDGTAFDANEGTVFRFTGAGDTTLANILNGAEEKTVTVYGTDTADVSLTVDDVEGKIEVVSAAVLATADDYVKLQKIDGIWTEVARLIA